MSFSLSLSSLSSLISAPPPFLVPIVTGIISSLSPCALATYPFVIIKIFEGINPHVSSDLRGKVSSSPLLSSSTSPLPSSVLIHSRFILFLLGFFSLFLFLLFLSLLSLLNVFPSLISILLLSFSASLKLEFSTIILYTAISKIFHRDLNISQLLPISINNKRDNSSTSTSSSSSFFVFGFVVALLLLLNPCTLPFLSFILFSSSTSSSSPSSSSIMFLSLLYNFLLFSLSLLFPLFLVVFTGNSKFLRSLANIYPSLFEKKIISYFISLGFIAFSLYPVVINNYYYFSFYNEELSLLLFIILNGYLVLSHCHQDWKMEKERGERMRRAFEEESDQDNENLTDEETGGIAPLTSLSSSSSSDLYGSVSPSFSQAKTSSSFLSSFYVEKITIRIVLKRLIPSVILLLFTLIFIYKMVINYDILRDESGDTNQLSMIFRHEVDPHQQFVYNSLKSPPPPLPPSSPSDPSYDSSSSPSPPPLPFEMKCLDYSLLLPCTACNMLFYVYVFMCYVVYPMLMVGGYQSIRGREMIGKAVEKCMGKWKEMREKWNKM